MPAIDDDHELNRLGAAEVNQFIERRPHRPARIQHVVHEDDDPVVDRARDIGTADERLRPHGVVHQVVAVERDVEDPHRHVLPGDLPQPRREALCDRDAARPHTDEREAIDAAIAFHDFVGDPGQRPAHPVRVHHNGHTDSSSVFVEDTLVFLRGSPVVAGREALRNGRWHMQDLVDLSGPA